jgi:hypothetical protein
LNIVATSQERPEIFGGVTSSLSYIPIFMAFSDLVEMDMCAISFREERRMKIPSNLAIEFLLNP